MPLANNPQAVCNGQLILATPILPTISAKTCERIRAGEDFHTELSITRELISQRVGHTPYTAGVETLNSNHSTTNLSWWTGDTWIGELRRDLRQNLDFVEYGYGHDHCFETRVLTLYCR